MFYSHNLLARKAPLGQIWMAATMHSKINRKKLHKLNIIQICEMILDPPAPMALRLTGILMGGVVIVYERKVKLLLDDVNRLVAELNEAWRVKPSKGKAKARYEAVTLPGLENVDAEVEPTLPGFDASFFAARLEHMPYEGVFVKLENKRLDDLDEQYIHIDIDDDDLSANHHQAQAEDITLADNNHSGFAETFRYDRFERFDMREEEIHIDLTTPQGEEMPNLMPSPPRYDDEVQVDNTTMRSSPSRAPEPTWHDDAMPFNTTNPQDSGGSAGQQDEQAQKVDTPVRPKAPKRRAARNNVSKLQIDNEQIIVSNAVYRSWVDDKDSSDILRKRRRVNEIVSSIKLTTLMELPPVAIITAYEKFPHGFYFPKAIMDLWQDCTRPMPPARKNFSLGDTPPEVQHRQNTTNFPEEFYHQDIPEFASEMFPDDSRQYNPDDSVEMMRKDVEDLGMDPDQPNGHFTPSSPGNYAGSARSGRSSGSGPTLPVGESEMLPTGRSKRRQQSSIGGSHLETVDEEGPSMAAFKVRRVSEEGPTTETETLMETGPTQTPLQSTCSDAPVDPMTSAIRSQLKLHFDPPGAPQHESLSQLAQGMNASRAAKFFYQTCVLATRNYVKVEQEEPYGDIQISRGPEM